jgi:hypothetical protein
MLHFTDWASNHTDLSSEENLRNFAKPSANICEKKDHGFFHPAPPQNGNLLGFMHPLISESVHQLAYRHGKPRRILITL